MYPFYQMFSVGYDHYCVDHLGNENKGSGLSIGTYPCHNPESAIDNQVSDVIIHHNLLLLPDTPYLGIYDVITCPNTVCVCVPPDAQIWCDSQAIYPSSVPDGNE